MGLWPKDFKLHGLHQDLAATLKSFPKWMPQNFVPNSTPQALKSYDPSNHRTATASPLQLKVILFVPPGPPADRSHRISSARSRRKISVAAEESQAPLDRRMDLGNEENSLSNIDV
jgi:hypothetical protein